MIPTDYLFGNQRDVPTVLEPFCSITFYNMVNPFPQTIILDSGSKEDIILPLPSFDLDLSKSKNSNCPKIDQINYKCDKCKENQVLLDLKQNQLTIKAVNRKTDQFSFELQPDPFQLIQLPKFELNVQVQDPIILAVELEQDLQEWNVISQKRNLAAFDCEPTWPGYLWYHEITPDSGPTFIQCCSSCSSCKRLLKIYDTFLEYGIDIRCQQAKIISFSSPTSFDGTMAIVPNTKPYYSDYLSVTCGSTASTWDVTLQWRTQASYGPSHPYYSDTSIVTIKCICTSSSSTLLETTYSTPYPNCQGEKFYPIQTFAVECASTMTTTLKYAGFSTDWCSYGLKSQYGAYSQPSNVYSSCVNQASTNPAYNIHSQNAFWIWYSSLQQSKVNLCMTINQFEAIPTSSLIFQLHYVKCCLQSATYTEQTGQLTFGGESFTATSIVNVNFVPCQIISFTASASNIIQDQSTYTYTIGDNSQHIIFSYVQSPLCGYSLTYSLSITAGTGSDFSWYTVSTTGDTTISIQTSNLAAKGTYNFLLVTTVEDGTNLNTNTITATIVLVDPCEQAVFNSNSVSNIVTTVLVSPVTTRLFSASTLNVVSVDCGQVQYSLSPVLPFMTLDSSLLTLIVAPTLSSQVSFNSVNLIASLTNYPLKIQTMPFTVKVDPCIITSMSVAANPFPGGTTTVTIFDPTGLVVPVATFIQTPLCGYSTTDAFLANTIPSTGFSSHPFLTQPTGQTIQIQTSDFTLDSKSFIIKQTTTASSPTIFQITQTMTIQFHDPCKTTQFVTQIKENIFTLVSPQLYQAYSILPILQDTVNQTYPSSYPTSTCYTQAFSVSIDGSTTISYMNSTLIASGETNLTFQTADKNDAGVHTVDVTYSLTRYPTITTILSFSLTFYYVVQPAAIQNQIYTIGVTQLVVSAGLLEILPQKTSDLKISYNATEVNQNILPTFVVTSFSSGQFQFLIQSSQQSDTGIYQLQLTTTVTGVDNQTVSVYQQFNLTVLPAVSNFSTKFAPTFVNLTDSFFIVVGDVWSYKLPQTTDPQGLEVQIFVDLGAASIFTQYKFGTLSIGKGNTTVQDIGNYTVNIKLINTQGATKKYKITLQINTTQFDTTHATKNDKATTQSNDLSLQALIMLSQNNQMDFNWTFAFLQALNQTKQIKRPPPPDVSITSISAGGLITLTFTSQMINPPIQVIQNATVIDPISNQEVPALTVQIQPGALSNSTNLTMEYNITSYSRRQIQVQVNFDNPIFVSSQKIPDSVFVQFPGYCYFFDMYGQPIAQNKTLQKQLPRQMSASVSAKLEEVKKTLSQSSNCIMAGNFVVNLVLSASLSQLWSMINTQQIIVMMPLFQVSLPANSGIFFGFIMQLASFSLLPIQDFYNAYLSPPDSDSPINQNFNSVGFSSMYFLNNLGSMVFGIIAIPILLVVLLILRILRNKAVLFKRLYCYLDKFLLFSFMITMTFEVYSMITVCVFINLKNIQFDSLVDSVNSALTIVFLVLCCIVPVVIAIFMFVKFPILAQESMLVRYGDMYENLDLREGKIVIGVPVLFLVRRFFLSAIVVYQSYFITQIFVLISGVLCSVILTNFFNTYKERQTIVNETFNEAIITIILYTFMCNTDFVRSKITQFNIGYISCIILVSHLMVNLTIMFIGSMNKLILNIKRQYYHRKKQKSKVAQAADPEKPSIPLPEPNRPLIWTIDESEFTVQKLKENSPNQISEPSTAEHLLENNQVDLQRRDQFEQTKKHPLHQKRKLIVPQEQVFQAFGTDQLQSTQNVKQITQLKRRYIHADAEQSILNQMIDELFQMPNTQMHDLTFQDEIVTKVQTEIRNDLHELFYKENKSENQPGLL